MRSPQGDW